MKPPTISEEDEEAAEAAAERGEEIGEPGSAGSAATEDKEVADWVKGAMERKRNGTMGAVEKPALHAAPLDTVPGSPLVEGPVQTQASVGDVEAAA